MNQEFAYAAMSFLAAGIVKGLTGIGYATCAMPLLALGMDLQTAIALVIVPAVVSNFTLIAAGGKTIDTLNRFSVFYFGILPGIAAGTMLLAFVGPRYPTWGLATLTLAYVVLATAKPTLSLAPGTARALALPAGVVNGILTGLTGSQIMPLVPYVLAMRLDPDTQTRVINLAVTIASMALAGALIAAGILTPELLLGSAAGAIPAITGTLVGNSVRRFLPVEAMRRLTLMVLLLAATGLVAGELRDVLVLSGKTLASAWTAVADARAASPPIDGAGL